MNSVAQPESREPTRKDGISFVSASIAGEGPDVAHPKLPGLLGGDVLRLGVDEAPDLVHLEPLAGEVPERLILVGDARLPDLPPQLHDGVLGDVRHAGGGADAAALDQGGHDLDSLLGAEHVCHTRHYA